jgi:hypothetical protein
VSRDISGPMLASLTSNSIRPCFLAQIQFKSETCYVWTGVGNLVYGGNTYLGVGDFGKFNPVTEGTEVSAYGTSISLSGIDSSLLSESLTDIQIGAPVTIYFVLLDSSGNIFGVPYPLFVGTVDAPTIQFGTKQMTITLALENKLANLQRATQRRYTSADQQYYFPDDCAFAWVESLNDQALRWTG